MVGIKLRDMLRAFVPGAEDCCLRESPSGDELAAAHGTFAFNACWAASNVDPRYTGTMYDACEPGDTHISITARGNFRAERSFAPSEIAHVIACVERALRECGIIPETAVVL